MSKVAFASLEEKLRFADTAGVSPENRVAFTLAFADHLRGQSNQVNGSRQGFNDDAMALLDLEAAPDSADTIDVED